MTYVRHTTTDNLRYPCVFNGYTTGLGGVSWGRFGRFGGGRRRKPVGGSKVPSKKHARLFTRRNLLNPPTFNGLTTGWGGVNWCKKSMSGISESRV